MAQFLHWSHNLKESYKNRNMPIIRVIQHVIACAFCAHVLHVSAQCDSTILRSGKAQKLLKKATDPSSRSSLEDRFEWLDEAIEMHPEDWEALMTDAELSFDAALDNPMYWDRLDNRLQDLKELCPQAVPKALFLQGVLAYWNRDNDAAMEAWKEFVMLPDSAQPTIKTDKLRPNTSWSLNSTSSIT